jgi:protein-S-isoprenylcysteine O-methyltransferase Ste14
MALIHSLETQGNFLFRYRGQIPLILFVAAIPVTYFTDYKLMSELYQSIITINAIISFLLGFAIRAYTIGTTPKGTSGRNTKEQVADQLNFTGIYSMVRHPLYLGNYFLWICIVLYTFNIAFVLIVSLAYWLYYERIMFAEERFLERKFGHKYLDWSMRVPAIIPSLKKYIPSTIPFSIKSVLRREYSGVFAVILGFCYVDVLRNYFITGQWHLSNTLIILLVVSAALAIVLRSLKHYTNVMNEEGRS